MIVMLRSLSLFYFLLRIHETKNAENPSSVSPKVHFVLQVGQINLPVQYSCVHPALHVYSRVSGHLPESDRWPAVSHVTD